MTDRRTKIYVLVVCNRLSVGGTERHLLQVLPALDRTRFSLRLFTTQRGGSLEPAFERVGIPVLGPPLRLPPPFHALLVLLTLTWQLLRDRPTIIHFFLPEAYILGGISAVFTGCRRMVMSRRSLNHYQVKHPLATRIEKWLHRRMALLLGNALAVTDQLRAEGAPAERIDLIYNGIDLHHFEGLPSREEARRKAGLPAMALVLITVANLIAYKGHQDLLDALARIATQLPDNWVLLCAGRDAGMGPTLEQAAQSLGIASHVRWLGEREDVPMLFQAADIGLLCSHEEGLNNGLLEGMAAGLPMIATRVGGNGEAICDGETGLIVPSHSPEALGAAILALAEDVPRQAEMGAAGRRRVEDIFSLATCVRRYEALYAALANDRKPDLAHSGRLSQEAD